MNKKLFLFFLLLFLFHNFTKTLANNKVVKLKFETFLKLPTVEKKSLDLKTLSGLANNLIILKSNTSYFYEDYLVIYNYKNDKFESYFYLKGKEKFGYLQNIYKKDNDLWISTEKNSFRYDLKTKKLSQLDFVFYSIEFEDDYVWFGGKNKIIRYSKKNNKLEKIWEEKESDGLKNSLKERYNNLYIISSISTDSNFIYFVSFALMPQDYAPNSELKKLDKEKGTIETIYNNYDNVVNLDAVIYECILSTNNLWCIGKNFFIQIDKTGKIIKKGFSYKESPLSELIKNEPQEPLFEFFQSGTKILSKNLFFYAYFKEKVNKLFGDIIPFQFDFHCSKKYCYVFSFIYNKSIFKFNIQSKEYLRYVIDDISVSLNSMEDFFIDKDYVVFWDGNHDITLYDRKEKNWKTYTSKDKLSENPGWEITSSNKFIIIESIGIEGTKEFRNGICEFTKKTKKWKCYDKEYWNVLDENPTRNYIWDIQIDNNENIWFTNWTGAFIYFDRKLNKWKRVGKFGARGMIFDKDKIWIGSYSGLMFYDKKKNILKSFVYNGKKNITKGCSWIIKADDWIWCSPWIFSKGDTIGYGLKRFNVKTKKWVDYAKEDGKIFDSMFFKPKLENKFVWFPHNFGVLRYSKIKGTFKNYGTKNIPCYDQAVGKNYLYCLDCPENDLECKKLLKDKKHKYIRRYHKISGKKEIISLPNTSVWVDWVNNNYLWIKEDNYLKKTPLE